MQKKTAQTLKKRHKARRLINFSGHALQGLSPAFRKIVKELDKVDKKVRKEAEDLNYYLGMAKSFYRRKDYISSANYLRKFHEKAKLIHHNLNSFINGTEKENISKHIKQFILNKSKGKSKKELFDYDPDKDLNKIDDGIIAQAQLGKAIKDWWRVPGRFSDMLSNFTDSKSQSMKNLESNFSVEEFERLKEDTEEMLKQSNSFYKHLINSFQSLGAAWATRNVGAYSSEIKNNINKEYDPFHKQFVEYYKNNIIPLKKEQEEMDEANRKTQEEQAANREKLQQNLISPDPFPEDGVNTKKDIQGPNTEPYSENQPRPQSLNNPEQPSPNTGLTSVPYADTKRVLELVDDEDEPVPATMRSGLTPFEGPPTPSRSIDVQVSEQKPEMFNKAPSTHFKSERVGPPTLIPVDPTRLKHPPTLRQPFEVKPESKPQSSIPISQLFVDKDTNKIDDGNLEQSNLAFLDRVASMSKEDDVIREILRYSEEVEKYSEDESLKLLSIAEGMLEKKAGLFDKAKEFVGMSDPKKKDQPIATNPTENKRLAPKEDKEDLLVNIKQKDTLLPADHGIPAGKVNKRWKEIPFLASKSVDDIILSGSSANNILGKIAKFLFHKDISYTQIDNFADKVVAEFKNSIPKGQLVSNIACNDKHNPKDCRLEVFSAMKLEKIDPRLKGILLSYTATCRLAAFEGDITISGISGINLHRQG